MKISEYIQHLNDIAEAHGDLEVESLSYHYEERQPARPPRVGFRKVLGKRERKEKFFVERLDRESERGEKVVRIF